MVVFPSIHPGCMNRPECLFRTHLYENDPKKYTQVKQWPRKQHRTSDRKPHKPPAELVCNVYDVKLLHDVRESIRVTLRTYGQPRVADVKQAVAEKLEDRSSSDLQVLMIYNGMWACRLDSEELFACEKRSSGTETLCIPGTVVMGKSSVLAAATAKRACSRGNLSSRDVQEADVEQVLRMLGELEEGVDEDMEEDDVWDLDWTTLSSRNPSDNSPSRAVVGLEKDAIEASTDEDAESCGCSDCSWQPIDRHIESCGGSEYSWQPVDHGVESCGCSDYSWQYDGQRSECHSLDEDYMDMWAML